MAGSNFKLMKGHTAHSTLDCANKTVYKILDYYAEAYQDLLAVPVTKGVNYFDKSTNQKTRNLQELFSRLQLKRSFTRTVAAYRLRLRTTWARTSRRCSTFNTWIRATRSNTVGRRAGGSQPEASESW
jgi:hypothetical protein